MRKFKLHKGRDKTRDKDSAKALIKLARKAKGNRRAFERDAATTKE